MGVQNNNPSAWIMKGNTLYLQGEYEQAVAAYDQALALSPIPEAAKTNKKIAMKKLEAPAVAEQPPAPAVSVTPEGFVAKLKEWLGMY